MTRIAAELSAGESGRVAQVTGADEISRRLMEMGITPGVQVTPGRDVPQCAVILLASCAYMSGIGVT